MHYRLTDSVVMVWCFGNTCWNVQLWTRRENKVLEMEGEVKEGEEDEEEEQEGEGRGKIVLLFYFN